MSNIQAAPIYRLFPLGTRPADVADLEIDGVRWIPVSANVQTEELVAARHRANKVHGPAWSGIRLKTGVLVMFAVAGSRFAAAMGRIGA